MNIICGSLASLGLNLCSEPFSLQIHQDFVNHVSQYGLSYGTQEEYAFRLA
jgi:hypothetical protein